jgi:hypothetical protein
MSSSRNTSPAPSSAAPGVQEKPGFRTKTIATRITSEELAEVEAAAQHDGKTLAEWLRELALKTARQRPADPMELLLAEVVASRYVVLNLFHATAQANAEGKDLLAESVLKIRDQSDAKKFQGARKLMTDFLAQDAGSEDQNGGKP